MDGTRSIDDDGEAQAFPDLDEPVMEAPPAIGGDERRMHVRAYNHWVSLLAGRAYPSVDDLDPAEDHDFGPNAVLLDFSAGAANPALAFLGERLAQECGLDRQPIGVAEVPERSLLSRLTDQYPQIIANRAPIGFEAEFINLRGHGTLYRGVLMPFSSNDEAIDFIYGVINWKELAAADVAAGIAAEVERTRAPTPPAAGPVWADGPSGAPLAEPFGDAQLVQRAQERAVAAPRAPRTALADHLDAARDLAATAEALRSSSDAALYRAIGLAHDLAISADARPEDHAGLLAEAGIRPSQRAPMHAVARLVFGDEIGKSRLDTIAAALAYAREARVPAGALGALLEATPGGLTTITAARRSRRAAA